MDQLEISGPHGILTIFCVIVGKDKSPIAARGHQHLRYRVSCPGFSGEADGFVAEEDLRSFCRGLIDLADGGNSEPKLLEDPAAGGIDVKFRREPETGHISIEGRISRKHFRTTRESDSCYTWGTQFGFWVPQDSLGHLRKVRWIEQLI